MLELGQPTHPYDAAHVAKGTLRARRARPANLSRRSTECNVPSRSAAVDSATPGKIA